MPKPRRGLAALQPVITSNRLFHFLLSPQRCQGRTFASNALLSHSQKGFKSCEKVSKENGGKGLALLATAATLYSVRVLEGETG